MKNITTNTQFTPSITLRQLRSMIQPTSGKELPLKSSLKEAAPIATFADEEFHINVYKSRFALVRKGKHQTVIRADEKGGYSYDPAHRNPDLSTRRKDGGATPLDVEEEVFLDKPWPIKLVLMAEDQIAENADNNERRWLSEHANICEEMNELFGAVKSVEDEVVGKLMMAKAIKTLTEKQKDVFVLYYVEGYSQEEIAERFGVTQETISKHLITGLKKVRAVLKG